VRRVDDVDTDGTSLGAWNPAGRLEGCAAKHCTEELARRYATLTARALTTAPSAELIVNADISKWTDA
jgi:hypothetical protein